jgi:hypothetical protein
MLKIAAAGSLLFTAFLAVQQTGREVSESAAESRAAQPPGSYEEARQIAQATPGHENLKRIGLAFHGYHDLFGRFPPAVLYGPDGNTKYSWRVELLPVLKHYVDGVDSQEFRSGITREQYNDLIKACGYDISASWDSDTNAEALARMPDVYRHPNDSDASTESAFYAVTGTGTAFDAGQISRYTDIKGWVASTLMLAELRSREPWTKPVDILYSEDATVPRFGGYTDGGALVLTCDGAVHFLHEDVPAADRRSLITRDERDSFSIIGIPYRFK